MQHSMEGWGRGEQVDETKMSDWLCIVGDWNMPQARSMWQW